LTFTGVSPRRFCSLQAGEHVIEAVAPGHEPEALGGRVSSETFTPVQTGGREWLGQLTKRQPCRRTRQLRPRAAVRRVVRRDRRRPARSNGSAASQPDARHTEAFDRDPDQPDDLVVGEELWFRQPNQSSAGIAVGAAQRAPVGE